MKGTLSIISDIAIDLTFDELETLRSEPVTGHLKVIDHTTETRECLLGVQKHLNKPYEILPVPKEAAYENTTGYAITLHWDTWNEIRAQVRLREDAWKPVFVDRYTPLSSQFTIHVR